LRLSVGAAVDSQVRAGDIRCQTQLDARVNNLIAKMTLDEKVGQLNQVNVDKTNLEQAIAAGTAAIASSCNFSAIKSREGTSNGMFAAASQSSVSTT
jgi:hypothetical protein